MALAHCILDKFLGVGCHCFPPPLDVPTFSARCLHVQRRERPPATEGGTLRGREMFREISSRIRLPRNSRDLLHAANLRHGTESLYIYSYLFCLCWCKDYCHRVITQLQLVVVLVVVVAVVVVVVVAVAVGVVVVVVTRSKIVP